MVLRGAWDEGRLQSVRAKEQRLAEGAHLSLLGHVTPDELLAKMSETDFTNGFANRVLLACVKRARRIPSPTSLNPALIGGFAKRLRAAMDFARERRVLSRTPDAEAVWSEFYHGEPDREGIAGAVTARAAAQRLRLSVAYALLDKSAVIRSEHVFAAEAVWRYCADSVEHLFGSLRGDRVQDRLLQALRAAHPEGFDGAAQHALFGRNVGAERLEAARRSLEGRALIETQREATGGRDRILSFAIPRRTNEKRRKEEHDNLFIRLSSYVRTREEGVAASDVLPV